MAFPVTEETSRWVWQATERIAFVASHTIFQEEGAQFRVGVDYALDVAKNTWEITVVLSWAIFVWMPIFFMMRARLFPIQSHSREGQTWESICHFAWAFADAFVITTASDLFSTGTFFTFVKGLLMVAWYIWAYKIILIRHIHRRFV
ncbi:hypothetical protein F5Y02DRAFT_420187 [Annulohypoxylon stygium]|nr:hypothetical protein F5Y02DRAFT_420187 [Annulohypoxylon stygium]